MERWKIIELLRNAERDIEEGEKLLATQRRAVEELERNGEATSEAADLLRTFEESYTRHLAERDRLRAALNLAPPTPDINQMSEYAAP
ncbi:MAG: hypothetical protein K0R27_3464 [Xanthobacteraceae bacterium]|nr:hypothetical protein [Xanthobacteraceae bacterium]